MSRFARSPLTSRETTRLPRASNWYCPRPGYAVARLRPVQVSAAVDLRRRRLTLVASRMQMPNNKAKTAADAVNESQSVGGLKITLEGRSVIIAMCVGQLGSLLPHVVV